MVLDEQTRRILTRFVRDVRELQNEAAKTTRFSGLISELFPGSSAPTEFAAGVAKFIRIDTATGSKGRFVDAYYGNAIIEFENSLKATEAVAKGQLKEYTSGLWKKEGKGRRPLVCIASDGVTWKV